ncbi:MAG: insulinase family protein [Ignavibacteriae bacterium]|nr:insulinase family protein [Ignavibacteria bacterium]MBI3364319.1 insulinase family protein [Ignavibacteriota bacterium]
MKPIRILTACLPVVLLTVFATAKDQPGLKFTELPSTNSPLVTFRIILRAGSVNDPPGKEGLNALTASLIANGGTKNLTYAQVVEKLYPWAASIDVQPNQEITTFMGEVHRDHLEKFYKLFSDLLLQPRFDESDFSRLKDEAINYIQNGLRSQNDEELGKQSLNAFLFDNHPYGKLDVGTVQGLTSITLDDVKSYYKNMYTQANLWVGIAGGYSATLVETIKKDFAALPAGTFREVSVPAPEPIKDMEVMVVEKPTRAYGVSMGYALPITRKDKDYYALMVANSYFGEHRTFNGVLMNRLRGDRGLNYGDYSYIEKFEGGLGSNGVFPTLNTPLRQQFFSIWLRPVQPENTHFAIRNALFELKNLVERELSKDDFEQTRKFVISYSKLSAATMSRRLGYMMDSEFYGSDYYIDRIDRELKMLTVDDVNAAIKKYLHPSDIKIAVAVDEGKGKDFLDAMTFNKPSPIKYQSPVSQNILDQDKLIEVFPLTVNAAKSKVVNAKELFER